MHFFIKNIFDGAPADALTHLQFQKFSKGEYKDRAMIHAKKTAKNISIGTTAEYGNELVRAVAEKVGEETVSVSGVVVSTLDLTGELDFKDKKQFQGVKRYILETEMTGTEIVSLCDKFPKAFVGLSFSSSDGTILKIKPKAPKSGKPSSKGDDKPKVDFCKVKTTDTDLIKALLFDVDEFKEVLINHTFVINDIEVDYDIEDPKEMREAAIRKGTIIRTATIDGTEQKTEKAFTA